VDADALNAQNRRARRVMIKSRVADINLVARTQLPFESRRNPGTGHVERQKAAHEKRVYKSQREDAETHHLNSRNSSVACSEEEPLDADKEIAGSPAWHNMMPGFVMVHAVMRVMTM
jgi:hypothetical protein